MTRTLLGLAVAAALAIPPASRAAEPAKAEPAARPAQDKPAAKPQDPPKEPAAEPARSGGYDAATMGFGKPPPRVGRLRPDSLLATSMKAAMEAPVGANDCESAYNGIKALFDSMKKMNYEPALRKEMPKKDAWVAQCKTHPPELQRCLVIKYQVEHKKECNQALEDAKKAGKGLDLDDHDHAGQSVPEHEHLTTGGRVEPRRGLGGRSPTIDGRWLGLRSAPPPTRPGLAVQTRRENPFMRLTIAALAATVLPTLAFAAGSGPDHDLLEAAGKGDSRKAKAAIAAGANVDVQDSDGSTALIYAAVTNDVGLANLLLSKGAKVDLKDKQGATALHVAVDRNSQAVAQALVAKGADVNAKEGNGRAPLVIAADRGKLPLVKLLLDKKADPSTQAADGRTPLIHAVNNEHFEVVDLLLARGADVNAAEKKGNTALIRAAQGCAPDEQELTGGKSSRPGHTKTCPKKMLALVKTLLAKGANVNARNQEGFTPVLAAIANDQRDIAKVILEKKPDLSGTLARKRTALMIAAAMGYTDIVKLMVEAGADLKAKDYEGTTALQAAKTNGHRDVVEILTKAGAQE